MDHKRLYSRTDELIDIDELRAALAVVDDHIERCGTHEACFERKVEILLILNEFEQVSRLILSRVANGLTVGHVALWTEMLYRMEAFGDCCDFVRHLPPYIRCDQRIAGCAWTAADYLKGRSKDRSWLEGERPYNLEIKAAFEASDRDDAERLAANVAISRNAAFEGAYSLAAVALEARDVPAFKRYVEEAKNFDVRRHQTLLLEARFCFWQQGFSEAGRCLDELLAIVPHCYQGLVLRAKIEYWSGRRSASIPLFEAALGANPVGEEASHYLGRIYRKSWRLGRVVGTLAKHVRSTTALYRDSQSILKVAAGLAPDWG